MIVVSGCCIGQWLPDLAEMAFGGAALIGQDFSLNRVTLLDLAEMAFQGVTFAGHRFRQERESE